MALYELPTEAPDWPRLLYQLGLKPARELRVEVQYFDTFDWRLWEAGFLLAIESSEEGRFLVLRELDDAGVARVRVGGAPVWAGDLPSDGPWLRVVKTIEMRALLPLVRCHRRFEHWQLRDALGKATARLSFEHDQVDGNELEGFLRIEPIRGYEPQGQELANAIRQSLHIQISDELVFERVLRAVDRVPEDTWQVLPALEPEYPTGLALKRTLRCYLETIERHRQGVLDDIDTEYLHEFRVALRRSRSLLSRFRQILPEGNVRFADEFRWLGAVTSPMRDFDVYLLEFGNYEASVTPASRTALAPLHGYIKNQRADAFRAVAEALRSQRYQRLFADWRRYLEDEVGTPESEEASIPIVVLAQKRIWSTYRRAMRDGKAISHQSPAEALHDLRKTCKKLRYLLESFGSLFEPGDVANLLKGLRRLQNVLGAFQDLEIQVDWLRTCGIEMARQGRIDARSLLAIGELMGRLEVQRENTRDRFARVFSDFAAPRLRDAARSQFHPRGKRP